MSDIFSKEKRSAVMSKIKSRNTKPELMLRMELFSRGLRYKANCKGIPGTPDIVFREKKLAVFCHGCFWHQHEGCAQLPKSNQEYWIPKLETNRERDRRNEIQLREMGWNVLTIWECEIRRNVKGAADRVECLV